VEIAGAREPPGEPRGNPRVQVCLACERGIQRLELLGRSCQQCWGVAATAGGERDLPAQQAGAGLLEFIQRPRHRHGEQLGRRLQAASLQTRLPGRQSPLGPLSRVRPSARPRAARTPPPRPCRRGLAPGPPTAPAPRPPPHRVPAPPPPGATPADPDPGRHRSPRPAPGAPPVAAAATLRSTPPTRTSGCRNRTRFPISSNPSA
jgi:hypothetical protein